MTSKTTKWYHTLKGYAIWVILGLFYFAMGSQLNIQRGLFHAFFFVPMQYVIYTLSMKHLLPRFYDSKKNKIKYYNAILILSFTLFGVSVEVLYRKLFPGAFLHEFHFLSSFILYTILCLTALWAGTTKFLIGIQEKVSVEIETLKREKAESDLRFLKTQINPHFLFNALNNIYSMAYTGDESAPEKITMLSDMLRYVLYDCESDSISLYKEVDYIHSYLEFQQLKTEKRQNISLKLGTYDENYQIAPMLLVTFIENGFKHSQIEKNKEGFVNIYLTQDSERFLFTVDNSIPEHSVQNPNGKSRGIGIENARNRLNLLYPNKHKLEIVNEGNRHKISLELYK
ncbi:MAG TPA: sensor histidine kinase [Fermentimonas sp.]|nr:sensor histidine kinase [Fermentimonas sp.]